MAILARHPQLIPLPRVGHAVAHHLVCRVTVDAVEATLLMDVGRHPLEHAVVGERAEPRRRRPGRVRRRGGRLVHLVPAFVARRDATRSAVASEALTVADVERNRRMHARRLDVRPRPVPLVRRERVEGGGTVGEMTRVTAATAGVLAVRAERELVPTQMAGGAQLADVLVGRRAGQSPHVRKRRRLTVGTARRTPRG